MKTIVLFLLALLGLRQVQADQLLEPYLQGHSLQASIEGAAEKISQALEGEGFVLLGEHKPYPEACILVVTREDQLAAAASTETGGFAAVTRVALTEVEGEVQVAVTNPDWMAASCRLNQSLSSLLPSLEKVLGELSPFGCEKGFKTSELRKYHYMISMPYFDDQLELADYGSQEEALLAVEAGLKAGAGGVTQVARVEIPEQNAVLFCVALAEGDGADAKVMATCDTGNPRHTAHLPYELLVVNGKVRALHAKFRIANSFPDLTMGTFMKIVKAPGAIEDALEAVASPR